MNKRMYCYMEQRKFNRAYETFFRGEPGAPSSNEILLRKRIMRTPKRWQALKKNQAWKAEVEQEWFDIFG